MNIIVLGAGAIGSVYGAKLSRGNDVTLVGRAAHAAQINGHGLQITGLEESVYRLRAVTALEVMPPDALVLLTTKASDSEAAVRSIAALVRADTTLLCIQNGLYVEDIPKSIVGDCCTVLRAITNLGAIYRTPGVVELKALSSTSIEQSRASAAIAETFRASGLEATVSQRIKDEMWRKLIVNCVINPVNAITRTEVGAIADQRLDPLKRLIVDECVSVARRDGVEFDEDMVDAINRRYGPSRNLSSMQQDLLQGRRTEIDFLNGAVVRLGESFGIPCPVNQALTTIIRQMESAARSATPA
ncbi:MAG TPA: 2-dehydropantoate 2-reductase [Vicinamibacterales bacterium]